MTVAEVLLAMMPSFDKTHALLNNCNSGADVAIHKLSGEL